MGSAFVCFVPDTLVGGGLGCPRALVGAGSAMVGTRLGVRLCVLAVAVRVSVRCLRCRRRMSQEFWAGASHDSLFASLSSACVDVLSGSVTQRIPQAATLFNAQAADCSVSFLVGELAHCIQLGSGADGGIIVQMWL